MTQARDAGLAARAEYKDSSHKAVILPAQAKYEEPRSKQSSQGNLDRAMQEDDMKRSLLRFGATSLAILAPVAALAHPGAHIEGLSAGFTHPFTGLDHLIAMVVVGVWAAFLGGRALWAVPASFVALLGVGAALGAHGATLPGVEHVIAASVFVLGLAF